jgi:hypothetical protein
MIDYFRLGEGGEVPGDDMRRDWIELQKSNPRRDAVLNIKNIEKRDMATFKINQGSLVKGPDQY